MIGVIGLADKFTIFDIKNGNYTVLLTTLEKNEIPQLLDYHKSDIHTEFNDSYFNRSFIRKLFRHYLKGDFI